MKTEIAKIDVENEMDIVLAHRRAIQVFKFTGANIADQTRFATAVSEITRNTLDFCNGGNVVFNIVLINQAKYQLEAVITDCGAGIADLKEILSRNLQNYTGKGRGIIFQKNL